MLFFYWYGDLRYLHVLTHSFPTRRSADLVDKRRRIPHRQTSEMHLGRHVGEHEPDRLVVCDRRAELLALAGISDRVLHRPEENTSELQPLMRTSYAVFRL